VTRKQKVLVASQCQSVEKLAEAVERINGVDIDFAQRLCAVKQKMQVARSMIYEEESETILQLHLQEEQAQEEA